MILERYTKQPREEKDYDIDYAPWLDHMGDTLDEVTADVVCTNDETEPTLVIFNIQFTASRAKFWVKGGTPGKRYKLTATARSVGGRIDESELIFTVKDY